MSYHIYKLKFPHGIHIGGSGGAGLEGTDFCMRSDTFYSAFCQEYVSLYGAEELVSMVEKDSLKVSDLLPFKGDIFYLPKPFVNIDRDQSMRQKTVDRKKVKALNYLPVEKLQDYISFLKTGRNFPEVDTDFGDKQLHTKNQISREGKDTEPYNIEIFRFNSESGLYVIAEFDEDFKEVFETVLDSLSLRGIGGKKSSSCGQFEVSKKILPEQKETLGTSVSSLYKALHQSAKNYILLSSYLPLPEEISDLKNKENGYQLIRRSGFVNLSSYSSQPQKRKQVHMISSGSVLNFKPVGKVADLKLHGAHSIYRMGKPLVMGVELCQE